MARALFPTTQTVAFQSLQARLDAVQVASEEGFGDRLAEIRERIETRIAEHIEHRVTQALDAVLGTR
jgi:hypothetical protein